jgi:hypothetical protein
MKTRTSVKILVGITVAALIFHFLILLKIIPYDITWGGKIKTDQEMYVFETFSILVNAFFVYVLLQKGAFIKPFFGKKTLTLIFWIFFGIFVLNTIGNLFATTTFEKMFVLVTLTNALLLWQINKTPSTDS